MEHAYDFYKPDMHSEYPVVDGKFSNTCYLRAFDTCYNRYMSRLGKKLNKDKPSMDDIDYVVCHSPYAKLVTKSFARAVSIPGMQICYIFIILITGSLRLTMTFCWTVKTRNTLPCEPLATSLTPSH